MQHHAQNQDSHRAKGTINGDGIVEDVATLLPGMPLLKVHARIAANRDMVLAADARAAIWASRLLHGPGAFAHSIEVAIGTLESRVAERM